MLQILPIFLVLYPGTLYNESIQNKRRRTMGLFFRSLDQIYEAALEVYKSGNYEKALRLFEQAGEKGHSKAQYQCGEMYSHGKGTKPNQEKALSWYLKAAQQGDVDAQHCCGNIFFYGWGTAKDLSKALQWYQKAAQQGKVSAQVRCGEMYHSGHGTAKDEARSLHWYEEAAKKKLPDAQFKCGDMYFFGHGTKIDHTKALYWYEQAARAGLTAAQNQCGDMYHSGQGTAIDEVKALYWYQQAAQQGDSLAQFKCGAMYYQGIGTDCDLSKALLWAEKAKEQGHAQADQLLLAIRREQSEVVQKLRSGLRSLKKGDTFSFGRYIQSASSRKAEPIQWKVLAVEGKRLLALSLQVLDCQKYHTDVTAKKWDCCGLRQWMNHDFYQKAFNDTEQKMIAETTLRNLENSQYHIYGCSDTTDKIFALSVEEAQKYFALEGFLPHLVEHESRNESARELGVFKAYEIDLDIGSLMAMAVSTDYAQKQDIPTVSLLGKKCISPWWLRTPGAANGLNVFVAPSGHIDLLGTFLDDEFGVRPAMWLDLEDETSDPPSHC